MRAESSKSPNFQRERRPVPDTRTFGFRSLGHITGNRGGLFKMPGGETFGQLLENWQLIVGNEFSEVVTPVGLRFDPVRKADTSEDKGGSKGRRTAVLTVQVPRHLAMEIHYRQSQIVQAVEDVFGYPLISRLKIKAGDDTVRPQAFAPLGMFAPPSAQDRACAEKQVSRFPEGELKEALCRLAAHISAQTNKAER